MNTKIKELKELRDVILKLDKYGYYNIFKICIKNNIKYTENKNGIFINLNKLDEKTINDFREYIKLNNNFVN